MLLYADYNATTPLLKEAKDSMVQAMGVLGNPSSIHGYGRAARHLLENARETVASFFKRKTQESLFTSGASEANNHILMAFEGSLITSALEHDSVFMAASDAQLVQASSDGGIDLSHLEDLLKKAPSKTLVSLMAVQNETGIIFPVEKIAHLCKTHGALFHCDATQALGKIQINFEDVDFITCSAHKIGGPAGVGALVFKEKLPLKPFIKGGAQEHYKRAGTQNLIGIAGFKEALSLCDPKKYENIRLLKESLEEKLLEITPKAEIYGKNLNRVANTICISLPGVKSETQVMTFDLKGVAIGSGSACSSGKIKKSRVLEAMRVPLEKSSCSIRLSFGPNLTTQDCDLIESIWADLSKKGKNS